MEQERAALRAAFADLPNAGAVDKPQKELDTDMASPAKLASSHAATEKQMKEMPHIPSISGASEPVGFIRSDTPIPGQQPIPSIENDIQPQVGPQPSTVRPQHLTREQTHESSSDNLTLLELLSEMGYTDKKLNWDLLVECGGNMDVVVDRLSSQSNTTPLRSQPNSADEALYFESREALEWLQEMGFPNKDENFAALKMCRGDIEQAVTILQQQNEPGTQDDARKSHVEIEDEDQSELRCHLNGEVWTLAEALEYLYNLGCKRDEISLTILQEYNGDVAKAEARFLHLRGAIQAHAGDANAKGTDVDADGEDVDTTMQDVERPITNTGIPRPVSRPGITIHDGNDPRCARSTWSKPSDPAKPEIGLREQEWTTSKGKGSMPKGAPALLKPEPFADYDELDNLYAATRALDVAKAEEASRSSVDPGESALSPGTQAESAEAQKSETAGAATEPTGDIPQGVKEDALAEIRARWPSISGLEDERRDSAHSRKNSKEGSRKNSHEGSRRSSRVAGRKNSKEETKDDARCDKKQETKADEKDQDKHEEDEDML